MNFLSVTKCLHQNILDIFISPYHNLRVSSRRAKIFFVVGIPMFGGALLPARQPRRIRLPADRGLPTCLRRSLVATAIRAGISVYLWLGGEKSRLSGDQAVVGTLCCAVDSVDQPRRFGLCPPGRIFDLLLEGATQCRRRSNDSFGVLTSWYGIILHTALIKAYRSPK